jgi:hypothetical protein
LLHVPVDPDLLAVDELSPLGGLEPALVQADVWIVFAGWETVAAPDIRERSEQRLPGVERVPQQRRRAPGPQDPGDLGVGGRTGEPVESGADQFPQQSPRSAQAGPGRPGPLPAPGLSSRRR